MTTNWGIAASAVGGALALIGSQSAAAQTPSGAQLILFSQPNQGGERRVITGDEADLSARRANDFARSLNATGDWEVCMDVGFRAGCRIVTGLISDLGADGGAISSARNVGLSRSGTGAAAAPAPQVAPAEDAYVYATVGFGQIEPELVLDGLGATVSGTYTATQSEAELDQIYRTGIYGITSGAIEGQMSGNRLSGYWYERATNAGLQTACETERNGTFVYGRFTLTFDADRNAFSGLRTSCDITPDPVDHEYETWNGRLIRRQAATITSGDVSNAGGDPVRPGSERPVPVDAQGRPLPGIVDRMARAAGQEVESRTQDRIREGIGRLF